MSNPDDLGKYAARDRLAQGKVTAAGHYDVPVIGARATLPQVLRHLVLKPGERLIVTIPGTTEARVAMQLMATLAASGIDRPIITAEWTKLTAAEPDYAWLVERILLLRTGVQALRDDIEAATAELQDDPAHDDLAKAAQAYRERLNAILDADAVNPDA